MDEREINKAIAAHCEWKYDAHENRVNYPQLGGVFVDITKDLNAIHEAEKHLNADQKYNYGEELRKISENVGPKGGHFTPNGWGCFALSHLNAKQKAEALVKVINHENSK